MKKALAILLICALPMALSAGEGDISAYVTGGYWLSGIETLDSSGSTESAGGPLFGAGADYGLNDQMMVGGEILYWSWSNSFEIGTLKTEYTYSTIPVLGTFKYLKELNDKTTVYGKAGLGLCLSTVELTSTVPFFGTITVDDSGTGLGMLIGGGANMAFNEKVGGFAELGYLLTNITDGGGIAILAGVSMAL